MSDETRWQPSRLIPVSGIRGEGEQERRGCSALLAVIESVRELGRALLVPLGAPAGAVSTFVEVPFQLGDRHVRPDGLIKVVLGKKSWTALVEVKTADGRLQAAQVSDYLDVARQEGFDVVLTISNEIAIAPGAHPTLEIDKKKLKGVQLAHLSWSQIHTEALIKASTRQVADTDQAWILNELIRYLEHDNSGAVDFQDMGEAWAGVRDAAAKGSLRPKDQRALEVATRFDQLVAFAAMKLSRLLGVEVRPYLSKADLSDIPGRLHRTSATLTSSGVLEGLLRVPHAAADIRVVADLRSGHVRCSAVIDAPKNGKQTTRVRWLLRQIASAPDDLRIEATTAYQRLAGPSVAVTDARQKPELLVVDKSKDIRSLTLTLAMRAGTKRGAGRGSFSDSVLDLIEAFYTEVVQSIKPWAEPAPAVEDVTSVTNTDHIAGELPAKTTPRQPAAAVSQFADDATEPQENVLTLAHREVAPSADRVANSAMQEV